MDRLFIPGGQNPTGALLERLIATISQVKNECSQQPLALGQTTPINRSW